MTQLDQTISLDTGISSLSSSIEVDLDSIEGVFELNMAVFETSDFDVPVASDFSVTVPDMIDVGVSIVDSTLEDQFNVQLKKCWATPS